MTAPGLRLYEFPRTRSARCRWLLQEIGVPFEAVVVDLRKNEHRSPDHLARNPYGRVPVLEDGHLTLFESAAICLHLAHRHPEAGLLPAPGTLDRSEHDQWLFFVTNELEQPLWRIRRHTVLYPRDQRLPGEVELARADFHAAARILDFELEGRSFVVGDSLTVVDVVLGYTLSWASWASLLDGHERLQSYLAGMKERPAFPDELR